jgi:hypothetical protein
MFHTFNSKTKGKKYIQSWAFEFFFAILPVESKVLHVLHKALDWDLVHSQIFWFLRQGLTATCPGCPQTLDPPASASQVTWIAGVRHYTSQAYESYRFD